MVALWVDGSFILNWTGRFAASGNACMKHHQYQGLGFDTSVGINTSDSFL